MVCNSCNFENEDDVKFCGNCGAKLVSSSENLKIEETQKANVFSNVIDKYSSKMNEIPNEEFEGKYKSNYRDTKKIGKKIPILLCLFLVAIAVCVAYFVTKKQFSYSKEGKRTIMIYMIGSDLESKYLAATKDIDEMTNSNINFEDINILIYTGGAKKWHKGEVPSDKHALFKLDKDGLVKIEEYDSSSNMLDPGNLTYLLNYGYNNYDTEYYDLIFWDHGAGPIYGYGYDEYNKLDSMSLEEIKKALSESPFNGGNKLELIGFDACLMSSIEVASVVSDYANYMVASQEFEPGNGWDYSFLKEVNDDTTSVELGQKIIDYFDKYYTESKTKGISLSLLNLKKVESINNYINELFEVVDDDLVLSFSSISRTRSYSKSFGRVSDDEYYYDLVDLHDLISKLPEKYKEKVSSLETALDDLIIYQKTDLENTNGISIYFPYDNRKELTSNMKLYKEFGFAELYYKFISDFSSKLTGKKISEWDISKNQITSSGEGKVSIVLPKTIIDNYSSADYIIFERSSDGYFTPIFKGSDVTLDGNTISTTISKKNLVVTDSEGTSMYLTAIESQRGNNFVKYYIPATLSKIDSEKLDFDILAVYLEFIVDENNPKGYISNVYPMDINENHTYSKFEINIKEWDTISLLTTKYKILDKKGKYTSNWSNSGIITGIEFKTNETINIVFSDLDISKDYYCIFRVRDSQGNLYSSNIVKINNK
jgi:hypothetical protein